MEGEGPPLVLGGGGSPLSPVGREARRPPAGVKAAGFPHATLGGVSGASPNPGGRGLVSQADSAGGGGGPGFLGVCWRRALLVQKSHWALPLLFLWPERATLVGGFCLYPLAFPVAEVFKSEAT